MASRQEFTATARSHHERAAASLEIAHVNEVRSDKLTSEMLNAVHAHQHTLDAIIEALTAPGITISDVAEMTTLARGLIDAPTARPAQLDLRNQLLDDADRLARLVLKALGA